MLKIKEFWQKPNRLDPASEGNNLPCVGNALLLAFSHNGQLTRLI
jgi:hypothetical protein